MELRGTTEPLEVSNSNLSGSSFDDVDMSEAIFRNANLQRL
jgi:uncharacterized protein YjbI with pentapeptide repeats